ncbi:MAG: CopG family transcriptional regulator [Halanaerobiales bacterium]|nr:CopG family transcriptional regulator [Halanaerobiales bacterium]
MEEKKEIKIIISKDLLKDVNGYIKYRKVSRDKFITDAVTHFLCEHKKIELREQLKKGYIEMSDINLELAHEGLKCDGNSIKTYEKCLVECE